MTLSIILTHEIIIATSLHHYHVTQRQLDTWQIFYFKKNLKKNKK